MESSCQITCLFPDAENLVYLSSTTPSITTEDIDPSQGTAATTAFPSTGYPNDPTGNSGGPASTTANHEGDTTAVTSLTKVMGTSYDSADSNIMSSVTTTIEEHTMSSVTTIIEGISHHNTKKLNLSFKAR